MRDPGWRDPDLPDGVVRFPPEPRPSPAGRRRVILAVLLLLAAAVAWSLLRS